MYYLHKLFIKKALFSFKNLLFIYNELSIKSYSQLKV